MMKVPQTAEQPGSFFFFPFHSLPAALRIKVSDRQADN